MNAAAVRQLAEEWNPEAATIHEEAPGSSWSSPCAVRRA